MKLEPIKRRVIGHPDQVIIAAWVLVLTAAILPVLIRGDTTLKCPFSICEMGLFNLPFRDYTGAMLKLGLAPTWTPQIFCGFPATAYPGTNLTFPPFYLLMFLDFVRASALELLVCFALAGAFAHLAFRRMGLSPAAALVGMLASVGSMLALWESSYTWGEREVLGFALAGWGVAGMSRGAFRLRSWFGVGLGLSLLLGYHPELFLYSAMFFLVLAGSLGSPQGRLRPVLFVASALAAAVLALGAAFLGMIEYLPQDVRGLGVTFGYYLSGQWPYSRLLQFFLPASNIFFGYPSPMYLGLSVLWLCALALIQLGRRGIFPVAGLALIWMLALDVRPLADLAYLLPLLNRMLLHYYLAPGALVLIAALAGRGAEAAIASGFRSRWAWLAPALIGGVLAAGAARDQTWLRALLLTALGLAAAAGIFHSRLLETRSRRAIWIVALVAADLTIPFFSRHPSSPMAWFDLEPAAAEFLTQAGPERFWTLSQDAFLDTRLHPDMGMRLNPLLPGTSSPLGFWRHPPIRIARLLNLISPGYLDLQDGKLNELRQERPTGPDPFSPQALPLLSVMNVGWVLSKGVELSETAGWERRPGKLLLFFRNPGVLARARTVSRWQVARDEDESLAVMAAAKLNFQEEAVVEARAGELKPSQEFGPPHPVRMNQMRPGYWDLELEADGNSRGTATSVLVVAETLLPGWRAFLDGREVPIHFANYAFMGVLVPPGPHRVVLVHHPWAFRLGIWLSLGSLLGWLLVGLTRLNLRPARPPHS